MTVLKEENSIYLILIVFLTVASYTDLKYSKVYNVWILAASVPAIYINTYKFFIWAGISIACGFILYVCRMVAAGDIKLVAYICGLLGPVSAGKVLLISLSIAAIYALYFLLSKKILCTRLIYFKEYLCKCIKSKSIYEYYNSKKDDKSLTMPLSHWFLIGCIVWRVCKLCIMM